MKPVIIGEHVLSPGKQFGLSTPERRQHLYINGQSGTGKTTLLENLIIQDIEAGRGVGFIDIHGDSSRKILEHIPGRRVAKTVYFDASDLENPVGFNLLAKTAPDERHLVASGLVSVFKGIWPDFWGPRMEYILYAAVAALLDCQNVSLLSLQRMLSDERYRNWVIRQVKDPMVQHFWKDEFARWDKSFRTEAVAPIQNKVGQLLMSPHTRNVLGQVRRRLDMRFQMDKSGIFIANLAKGKLGDDKAALLGSLLVTQFQLAAMSRADTPEALRKDFFLYVDECASIATDSFASILSEARKYRLGLVLASQHMSQLRPSIRNAILGNVGSIVAFRVGHDDANALEQAYGGIVRAGQFTNLQNREVYAKLLSSGRDMAPVYGRTLPPLGTRHGRHERAIRRSREKYAAKREDVERKIQKWLGGYRI